MKYENFWKTINFYELINEYSIFSVTYRYLLKIY